jgi:hypothetical protein
MAIGGDEELSEARPSGTDDTAIHTYILTSQDYTYTIYIHIYVIRAVTSIGVRIYTYITRCATISLNIHCTPTN